MLALRLINKQSKNDSYEQNMVQILKNLMGYSTVKKMIIMRNDIENSENLMKK